MINSFYDVAVIGAGPAGLTAALAANERKAKTLLVEREENLGGNLKQNIHDGFGLLRFGKKLTGPEYAHILVSQLLESNVEIARQTFVTKIEKHPFGFSLTLVNSNGIIKTACKSIVFACGSRELTSRQIGIHGRHSAGIFTAKTIQYYINILGKMPGKRCVIFGSNDAGLIMARRLKLEGAEVLGVYEAKPAASGLKHNVYQCLKDFDIPLFTKKTITRVLGEERLNAVEISSVDENMIPIQGTEEIIKCDTLILSAGLIPENELMDVFNLPLDKRTKGPVADQHNMTMLEGIFCCGNALFENNLTDFVSESGYTAGQAAAKWALKGWTSLKKNENEGFHYAEIKADNSLMYVVPQHLNLDTLSSSTILCFRSKKDLGKSLLLITLDGIEIFRKVYQRLCPPEMERIIMDFTSLNIKKGSLINFSLLPAERKYEEIDFTKAETISPGSSLTTTVHTIFPEVPVLPVKIKGEVPKDKINMIIRELSDVMISERIGIGETIAANILGTGCDIIATSNKLKEISRKSA